MELKLVWAVLQTSGAACTNAFTLASIPPSPSHAAAHDARFGAFACPAIGLTITIRATKGSALKTWQTML
eukprot:2430945-Amphidinium_carterae.1